MSDEVPTKHSSLIEALAAAQGEFGPIVKDKKVEAGPRKYAYADLAAVIGVVRPVLSRHGIALIQPIEQDGEGLILHTKLCGYGEMLSSTFPITAPLNNPQGLGSFISYARRYSLCALVGVAADDDDDDGQAAGHKPAPRPSQDGQRPPAPREKPVVPPDDAWLEAAKLKVEHAEPDELRSWWNSPEQRRQRQDLHKRRADFAEPLEALKKRVAERWWECSSLEIPPNGMGWQKWQGLVARTIDAAPSGDRLVKLTNDNAAHMVALQKEVPAAHAALEAKWQNRLVVLDDEAPLDLHDDEEGDA
jgi:hypothetical protein